MINTITQVFEQLGLSAQKRAIHSQFSHAALNHDIFLQHIEGTHALNQGLNVELICLSTNALIPLKQFIGVQVAVDQVTDQVQSGATAGYDVTLERLQAFLE